MRALAQSSRASTANHGLYPPLKHMEVQNFKYTASDNSPVKMIRYTVLIRSHVFFFFFQSVLIIGMRSFFLTVSVGVRTMLPSPSA